VGTDVLPSISESQVLTVVRAVILTLVSCEVVKGVNNRVPMPDGDFILLTPMFRKRLAYNVDTYAPDGKTGTKAMTQYTQLDIQVDSYGALAGDRAQTLSTFIRDESCCEAINAAAVALVGTAGLDMQTLYAEEPHQMPLITGESQYDPRWTFEWHLQYNPTVTLAQQFAVQLGPVDLIDVDAQYPAT